MDTKSLFRRLRSACARSPSIRNGTGPEAEILIYDEIGPWGITAEQFVKDVSAITAPTIHVRLNTPGGDVFDGIAIYNTLKAHGSRIITHVDGLAASIGSVIAMAGDELHMAKSSYLMMHDPYGITLGGAADHRKTADVLDKLQGTIAEIYADKADGGTATFDGIVMFKGKMDAETWLTAQEAKDLGLADTITDDPKEDAAKAQFDLSIFANVPDALRGSKSQPKKIETVRELETFLRDVGGFSKSHAKAIAACGFNKSASTLRDEEAADWTRLREFLSKPNLFSQGH